MQVVLNEEPGALVLRLVLTPHQIGGIGILFELGAKSLVREGVELLDAHDGHIVGTLVLALFDQVEVDLARADDDAFDLLGLDLPGLADDGLKAAFGELGDRAGGVLVAQQRFGREDHQGLAQVAHHLPAQHMEDLAGRGRLHDLHIGVGRQLHEALDAGRTVLRALALVAVRQHEGDAIDTTPLDFARGDELVDHHLRAIGKVAKLRLPNDQGVGIIGRIAVFIGQHRLLRQDGVDDHKGRLVLGHVLQRHIGAGVPLFAVLVMDDRMPVGEGAPAAVFARQSHRIATGHQRRQGHVLAHAPVHIDLATAHGGAVVVHLLDQLVRGDAGRNRGDSLSQTLPLGHRNGGIGGIGPFFAQEGRPVDHVLALEVGKHWVNRVTASVHRGAIGLDHVVAERGAQALRGELVRIQPAGPGVLCNLLVHQRLGQAGGVLLVVAELAKAGDVDHHVLTETHAVLQRQLAGQHHRLRIVAVDVQHRGLDHLEDVGAKRGRAQIARIGGGKADLVVDDDVHHAAGGIAPGLSQRQGFLVDALAAKGGIAMHQHRQHLLALGIAPAVHAGAHRALDHRVDDFQVRRVESQTQVDRATRGGDIRGKALVVLDVTGR